MVLFGTAAELIFDINFIIQIILIILLIIGYTQRRTWKYHGIIMDIGTFTMLITVLLIMAPSLMANWPALILSPTSPSSLITIVHVVLGSIALAVALFFMLRFLYFYINKKPLTCGTRTQMRIHLIIWILAFIFGLVFYIYVYVI
jgi:hypothetical protein